MGTPDPAGTPPVGTLRTPLGILRAWGGGQLQTPPVPPSPTDTPKSHRAPQPCCPPLHATLGLRGAAVSWQPANILLDEFGHVRISDLGLACDFSKKKPHASV